MLNIFASHVSVFVATIHKKYAINFYDSGHHHREHGIRLLLFEFLAHGIDLITATCFN